ncbi:MAG: hypothetical protein DRP96_11990 [Candidatus Neomarinimicrobiota bacterium]|nr:MAG: hypothetical protein DRP96_11990 [Candidatus Neomarinimicrobiota bacterium]
MKKLIFLISILTAIFAASLFAQEDVTPPTLTGFSFTPDAVDVTSGPATVTFTVNATDDISGLSSVTIYLESPSYLYCSSCSGNFESGILEGTYTGTLTIRQYSEAGEWKVNYILLNDIVGNNYRYYTSELETMGFPTTLNVYYTPVPEIISITDILNDQGKRVRLSWARSIFDGIECDSTIIGYSIWRRIDPIPEGTSSLKTQETPKNEISGLSFDMVGKSDEYLVACDASFPPGDWDFVLTVPAIGAENYNAVAPTLADSTIVYGMHWSVFTVIAHTDNPLIFFVSEPDSGYSLDNLAPHTPEGLLASVIGTDIKLTWEKVTDEDFNYYTIYRSTESGFDPGSIEPYTTTIDTFFIDTEIGIGIEYYYRISAIDFSGNEGKFSDEVSATIVGIKEDNAIPNSYALFQNYPNPFNPKTTISYQLPKSGYVNLAIYNNRGQLVETLVNEYKSVGYYSVTWDASKVGSGIYLYKISSGEYSDVKKCMVIK